MSDDVLIRVDHLYRYYGDQCAVQDLSFEVRKGEVLGFLGPNGAGKSTTMQALTGNLAPTSGEVWINGVDLLAEPKRAKAEIGYLPEQPPLYRELTVDEYLEFCARLNRIPRAGVRQAVETAKQRCGLTEVGRRLIGNLSKGFQQRVGIAQAIIHRPAVVILDEPTVGLDPIQIREIRALIRELGRDHSVILSTHILPEVQATCSRVQIIHHGRLVFSDSMLGLDERLAEPVLELRLARPPSPDALAAIPGVLALEPQEDGRWIVRHAAGESPAEAIAEAAVQGGWGLQALVPAHKSLEQVFVELTAGHAEPAADEEAA